LEVQLEAESSESFFEYFACAFVVEEEQ